MKIGLDFDGVIVDSPIWKPVISERLFGVRPDLRFCSRASLNESGLSEAQYEAVKDELYSGSYQFKPVDGAVHHIQALISNGCTLKVVTARTGVHLDRAAQLLELYGLPLSIEGVGYGVSKEAACLGLDVFVDDDVDKIIPLIGKVPHLCLFSWPFNESESVPSGVVRVSSWWELYNHIRYEI